jgi:BASS family bile acid:Na+ symporter
MLQRFLLFWLVLLSTTAYYWPPLWLWCLAHGAESWFPTPTRGFDPFVQSKPYIEWMIAAAMFVIGCLLPRDEVAQVARQWRMVLAGTALQYTAMPLLAYSIGHLFRLEREAMIGVILVGCVPGAMASNVLTLAARGNVSYSVSLTTSATLLSPLVVPLALWLTLGAEHELDPVEVGLNLLQTVVGPVVAGYVLCRFWPPGERVMQKIGPVIANGAILWIIAVVVGLNRERLDRATPAILTALLAINLLGYTAGWFGALALQLPVPMRRALTLEIGMQNAGLGTMLVLKLSPEYPAATIPTAAYTFGCMLTGSMLAQFWSWRRLGTSQLVEQTPRSPRK